MIRKVFYRIAAGLLTLSIGGTIADYYKEYHNRELWHRRCEDNLKSDLFQLRRAIDNYSHDKEELPPSLDDIVAAQYLSEVPVDPIQYRRSWQIVIGNDSNSVNSAKGIVDVHSTATGIASDGTHYSEW